jgi:hypothetical protein
VTSAMGLRLRALRSFGADGCGRGVSPPRGWRLIKPKSALRTSAHAAFRASLDVDDPQQLGAGWLQVRAQRAHGQVRVCPLARVQEAGLRSVQPIAGRALPDRLVFVGSALDMGETSLDCRRHRGDDRTPTDESDRRR